VVAVIEQSAIVRLLERAAGVIRGAMASSWLRAQIDRMEAEMAPRLGIVLLTAVISHLVLAMVARPRGAYWLMVPALVAVIAVILQLSSTAPSRPRE
jgi:TRAP-type C4-dicarboxylate transport system permease large subunit